MSELVTLEQRGAVTLLTRNRPETLNELGGYSTLTAHEGIAAFTERRTPLFTEK